MAQWITDWYVAGPFANSGEDNFLGWTERPDYWYQDWAAHNYDHHKFGYHGIQPPALFAARTAEVKYDAAVCYLANWIAAGKPTGSLDEKKAAKSASIMSHYIADMSQAMHTDSTSTLGEESSEAGTSGSSYHSRYEGKDISFDLMEEFKTAIASTQYNVNTQITDVEAAVKGIADTINTDGGQADVTSSEGDPVGAGYWNIVDNFYNNWNNNIEYLNSPGYDQALADKTKANLQTSTALYGQLLYSIYQDAEAMGSCNTAAIAGDVLFSEIYYDTASGDDGAQWIELCNQAAHPVDLSGWYYERPTNIVNSDTYYIEEGFMVLPGECLITTQDGSAFASDSKSLVKNSVSVCGADNQPNSFGGCSAYQTLDETYDSVYTPEGESMFNLWSGGDKLYLKDSNDNTMDFVAWEGQETGWDIVASAGKSIQRKIDADGNLVDTDSPDDWLSEQEPAPEGYLPIGAETNQVIVPVCGDGVCEYPDEDSNTCSDDCVCRDRGVLYYCGDGVCDPCETATQCANDCGTTSLSLSSVTEKEKPNFGIWLFGLLSKIIVFTLI